jgi:Rrf2 family protein
LARDPSEIRVREVVAALEGALAPVECVQDMTVCDRAEACAARDVWSELGEAMERVMNSITLAQLASRQKEKQSERHMYYI